ncbi:MAG: hypothetical protein MK101_03640 [Phycisphaerales bacterium]|nr:hypothetical protein [Phycisphaerales bacterium]
MSMPHRAKAMQETTKMLKVAWERAGEGWRDVQHERFGSRWLDPLERSVRNAASALDEVQVLLQRAERDCQ